MPNWDTIKPADVGVKDDSGSSGGPNWDALKEPSNTQVTQRAAAPSTPVSQPMHLPIHRTESENPLSFALRAGQASGKHLLATGKLGVPDVAGEDRDRAKIRHSIGGDRLPTSQMAPGLMINPTQGFLDTLIDTAVDPTNLIPFGKIGKVLGKGAGLGMKAGGALLDRSPQVVKDAAGFLGQAGNAIGDQFHWGGSARRDLSPEQYQAAGLEFNKHEARHPEAARRMIVRQAAIFSGLTDRQKIDVAKLMNGEFDVASDPRVMNAYREADKLRKDMFALEADASGRQRAAIGSTKVANAGLIKPEPQTSAQKAVADLFRYQSMHPNPHANSIINPDSDEFVALHPSAHGPLESPVDDFERMVPNDLPTAAKPNLKRIIGQNLPEHQLPPELREFQSPADQGVLSARNFRPDYHPGYQSAQTEADDFTRPHSYNLLNPFAGHALEREDFKIGDVPDDKAADTAAQLQAALTRRLKASAVQASAGQLRSALGVKPGLAPQALAKLFDQTPRAVGEARNWKEKGQDYLRLPADAARSTLTAFGLKHGLINVPTLAGLSEGGQPVADMFRDAGELMKMSPEERWEFMRAAREGGAIGSEHDRDNQTLGLLDKVPVAARAALGGAYGGYQGQKAESDANPGGSTLQRLAASGAGALVGGAGGAALPRIGRFSNDLTWALDESAKRAVFNAKVKKGMSPADAAAQTLKDTVDYTKRTPIAKGLQDWGLAPFATFATKIPGAVAGSVARNPHNAIMLDRLTQGLASNGTLDLPNEPTNSHGDPAQLAISNPLSETAEFGQHPMKYVRAKASDPARIVTSIIANALSGHPLDAFTSPHAKANYMTMGQPLLPHSTPDGMKSGYLLNAAASDIPLGLGRGALDAIDLNEFSPQSAASQILGPLFGAYLK